jgi:hypothetical protein
MPPHPPTVSSSPTATGPRSDGADEDTSDEQHEGSGTRRHAGRQGGNPAVPKTCRGFARSLRVAGRSSIRKPNRVSDGAAGPPHRSGLPMPVAGRSLLRKPNRVSDGDRAPLPRRSGLPMPVAGRSLRPSWASLARWFLRYAILAPRRKPAPAPGARAAPKNRSGKLRGPHDPQGPHDPTAPPTRCSDRWAGCERPGHRPILSVR